MRFSLLFTNQLRFAFVLYSFTTQPQRRYVRSTILATCAKFSRDIMHARAHSPNQSSFAIDSLNIRSFRYHFTHLFTLPYSYIASLLFSQTHVTSNISVFLDSSSCPINKQICVTFEVTKLWETLDERRKKV